MADTSTATQPAAASVAPPQPPAGSATDTATDSTVTPPPLPSGGAGGGAGAGVAATTDTATGATQATSSAAGDSSGAAAEAEKPVKHTHGLDLDFDVSAVEAAGINQLREAIHKRQKERAVALKAKAKAGEVIEMPPPPTDTRLFHFLLARKLDVASAVDKYFAWQDVEVKFKLRDMAKHADRIAAELATGKYWLLEHGKGGYNGPPVWLCQGRLHFPEDFTTEESMRTVVYLLFRMLKTPYTARNGFSMAWDCNQIGWANFDMAAEKIFLEVFQGAMPLRYRALVMLNPPFMMRAVMAIMKPFMKKKLRDRIRNLRTPEVIESLNLPPALTPTFAGGTLEPDYKAWAEECRKDIVKTYS